MDIKIDCIIFHPMNPLRKKNLRALAHMMNSRNVSPVPVTDALLDCFDLVITEIENEFLLTMGVEPKSLEEMKALAGMDDENFGRFLDGLLKKGLVHTMAGQRGDREYILTPILVGWFELYLSDGSDGPEKREFARRVEKYFEFFGRLNIAPLRNILNIYLKGTSVPNKSIAVISSEKIRRVDVNEKIKAGPSTVMVTKTVEELIVRYGSAGKIALMHCFCRQWNRMIGRECRFSMPAESCLAIGEITEYITGNGIGRYISTDEALALVTGLQKKGAVHTVFYDREDPERPEIGICSCCWDCCGVHGSYNRGRTHLNLLSHYLASVIPGECSACRKCIGFCPTGAITMTGKAAEINAGLCIGCGQCSFQCPSGAVSMKENKRHVLLPFRKKSGTRLG